MIADAALKKSQSIRNSSTAMNILMETKPIPIHTNMIMTMIRRPER